jgi:hypothetical protein
MAIDTAGCYPTVRGRVTARPWAPAIRSPGQPWADLSLSLPYVPGRLVIEVSGPARHAGQLADDGHGREVVTGRLALVPDTASSRTARTEVTGR